MSISDTTLVNDELRFGTESDCRTKQTYNRVLRLTRFPETVLESSFYSYADRVYVNGEIVKDRYDHVPPPSHPVPVEQTTSPKGFDDRPVSPLFNDPITSSSIQSKFEDFHKSNPSVFKKLVDLAFQAKANGNKQIGISLLFERLRWYFTVETKSNSPWKLNNNYRSRYARLIMGSVPALDGFFTTRELFA